MWSEPKKKLFFMCVYPKQLAIFLISEVLMDRLKSAEARAEYGEKTVQKLNLRSEEQFKKELRFLAEMSAKAFIPPLG